MVVDLKLTAEFLEPSAPRELFRLPAADTGFSPYDTAPDGQRFLVRAVAGAWSLATADGHRQLAGAPEGIKKVEI